MFKKALTAIAILLVTATPAAAQQYPIDTDAPNTISDTTVVPGQDVTVTFGGYAPGATVTFTMFSEPIDLGTQAADAEGDVSHTFTVPPVEPGPHRIEAAGTGADGEHLVQSISFTVVASDDGAVTPGTGAPDGRLARTGSDSSIPLRVAAGLVAVGGAALLLARRRRQAADT